MAISLRLAEEDAEAYRHARELGVEARLQASRLAMKQAANAFQLALAREGFKADVWFAECEFPERWRQGARATSAGAEAPMVQIVLSNTEPDPGISLEPDAASSVRKSRVSSLPPAKPRKTR